MFQICKSERFCQLLDWLSFCYIVVGHVLLLYDYSGQEYSSNWYTITTCIIVIYMCPYLFSSFLYVNVLIIHVCFIITGQNILEEEKYLVIGILE